MVTFNPYTLEALSDEADDLIAKGMWTKTEFVRLWDLTKAVSGGHDDVFESLIRKADPDWL